MQLRINLPSTDTRPESHGFIYCRKDRRWEKPGKHTPMKIQFIANELGVQITAVEENTTVVVSPSHKT